VRAQSTHYRVVFLGIGSPNDAECVTLDYAVLLAKRDRKPKHESIIYLGDKERARVTAEGELVYAKDGAAR
jgi:hypothetical protein